jgi:hypothetical protein
MELTEMSQDSSPKILVARSLTRKIGDRYEKILFQAEAQLAKGLTLEESFRDLHETVLKSLQEASTSSENTNTNDQFSKTTTESLSKPTEKLFATNGEELAQVLRSAESLTVKVPERLKLDWSAAPIQNFLIPRVLDPMWKLKQIDSYDVQRSPGGSLTGIRVVFGDLDPNLKAERVKDLLRAIAWTLRRLHEEADPLEHRHTGTPPPMQPPQPRGLARCVGARPELDEQ